VAFKKCYIEKVIMIKKDYVMLWPHGMHARPSGTIVSFIGKLTLDKAYLIYDKNIFKMNGIMDLLLSSISEGKEFTLVLDGPDEHKAFKFLDEAFTSSNEEYLYEKKKVT
jgi:phosphotransferase system HPr (HPr) family protein